MSLLTSIRKGFSFFLMSMGVATYGKKNPVGEQKPVPPVKPE
jgi:hypothetical protein